MNRNLSETTEPNTCSTHFGFETVPQTQKAGRVAAVFDSVANRYDLMNDLMSAGTHRLWKAFTLEISALRPGHRVLDLAAGTGDMSLKFARVVGPSGLVVAADINDSMLQLGRRKLHDNGIADTAQYVQADAESLPFADDYFDCVCIAFGLRNVTDKIRALSSMQRVLKPGGRLLVLEFSKPRHRWLEKAYDLYSFKVLPRLGQWIANDSQSYRYLAESIRMHPDQQTLKQMLEQVGFSRTQVFDLFGGITALHRGVKP